MDRLTTLLNKQAKLRKQAEKIDAEIRQIKHALTKEKYSKQDMAEKEDAERKAFARNVAALEVRKLRDEGWAWKRIQEHLHLTDTAMWRARNKAERLPTAPNGQG